ncbi:bifunctional 2-C-methyl-D-erythritol 4-phosphate cytidylyltransferase/2-C-methyl-D-erythritol 2,4-cyclodiphosphate synthase [Croceicoccus marinus]|jgi:2-C-methyl-D-erythritol 4-phosphate cytidylyltransferase/2-C-methyl-D-erythritol 2,4-cyclodiphosphate synthase|uniref:Bifunctional enzyme IspD/IspF n=2 Tax=Croceicoccus marinus TaxID=450378 RepID=A0A7G6VR31_9SPHN|nr:bifunctional 2-C-methyl-D-erythritol 4-phosphate cytidylyltransferase/2-C-methyl-D-erythritol 2,4-cyclodiphosphate synthase [Croceicoccus marinus]
MADMVDRSGADRNDTDRQGETIAGIIVAAGSGSRAGLGTPKQYAPYCGTTVLGHAVAMLRKAIAGPILIVIPPGDEDAARGAIGDSGAISFVFGGAMRQGSVRAGLEALAALPSPPVSVLIHDAARPDLPGCVAERLIAALRERSGAIPVLPVVDSMVEASGNIMGAPARREDLRRVQTPQAFRFADILAAHRAWEGPPSAGDDAQVLRKAGHEVALVDGDARLAKLTFKEDFAMPPSPAPAFRTGSGYDVHRLEPGDHVWLCGVRIEHDRTLAGHSDADVALHALTDAILGAVAIGDIGDHFPPSDPQWKGAASHIFLTHAVRLAEENGYRLANCDLTIICEAPKVGPHRMAMRERLAELLAVDINVISVKATTTERLGFTGRGEGIAAQAQVLLMKAA